MYMHFKKEMEGFSININNGLSLLLFKKICLNEFHISFDQSVLLVSFYTLVSIFGGLYLSLPNPNFTWNGIINIATQTFFVVSIIYIISRLTRNEDIILAIFIVVFSAWPWFYLICVIFGKNANFNYYEFYANRKYLYIVYSIWMIASIVNSVSNILRLKMREKVITWLILIFLLFIPLNYLEFDGFWYQSHNEEVEYSKFRHINTEDTYYN